MDSSTCNATNIASCLRSGNTWISTYRPSKHRVSFPEKDLVTGYVEPPSPWDNDPVSPEDLVAVYEDSCRRHGTPVLGQVVDQLESCWQPSPSLEINGPVDLASLEALEPVLRRVRFQTLRLQIPELEDDAAVALFDMLEYYEATAVLSISCDTGLGLRGWQACSRMIKKAFYLEELDVRGTALNEQVMPILCRSLKVGSKLTALRLGRCGLSGRCLVVLTAALKLNSTLQELTIADNELVGGDAAQISQMLRCNNTLKYLDISNNDIQDLGCSHICEGLSEQKGDGVEVLILWNTHLTQHSAPHIAALLASSSPLQCLNIGQNRIGSEGITRMKQEMANNSTLKQLGVQAAQITCGGAIALSEVLQKNTELRRIDARSNHIGESGLRAIQEVLRNGATVQRIDLDDATGSCQQIIETIRLLCHQNETKDEIEDKKQTPNISRKISLTCETLFMRNPFETNNNNFLTEPKRCGRLKSPEPSPLPSPSTSPVPSPKHRFLVTNVVVAGTTSVPVKPTSPVTSRFRVTLVEPALVVANSTSPNQIGFQVNVLDDSGIESPKRNELNNSNSSKSDLNSSSCSSINNSPLKQLDTDAMEQQERKRKISNNSPKPQTNLEKLLGIFQNPSSLFTLAGSGAGGGGEKKNTDNDSEHWEWEWSNKNNESQTKNNNIS